MIPEIACGFIDKFLCLVRLIAEQDYSAYPYASPFQGLREKLFQTIFSAPTNITGL